MPNKDKTEDYLSRLAEGAKTDPHFQSIQKWLGGRDIGEVFSPSALGFTKQAAVKEVVGKFFDPNLPTKSKEFLRGALADLLRVIGKTPKKATQHVKEFELLPGFATTGSYHPSMIYVSPGGSSTMAASYAHEAGHGASLPMAGRIQKRFLKSPEIGRQQPEKTGMDFYSFRPSSQDSLEGVAEYIGRHIQKQAGLKPGQFFGYGAGQERVFEKLSEMPSKNPYMNVYRFLQKLIASSAGGE